MDQLTLFAEEHLANHSQLLDLEKELKALTDSSCLPLVQFLKSISPDGWYGKMSRVLSSNRGKDFGTFLGMLGELGYGFAYRVLDAQYFGVAQRRRRVFVVGYFRDWKRPASVLFEPESLQGDLAESHKERQGTTRDTENSIRNCSELPRVTPCLNGEELKRHVSNQMITQKSWFYPSDRKDGNHNEPYV